MQIGLDASRLGVAQRTGTEHYTWQLLQALAQIDQGNHYTLYVNQRPPVLPPLPPHFALRAMPWPRAWTHLRLSAEMLCAAPDVLFVPAHVVPLVHPQRTVVTIHDLGYIHYPEAHPRGQRLYLRLSTHWSAWQAQHIIADSRATKADLIRYYGIAPAKITVVYLGVNERFVPVTNLQAQATVQAHYGIQTPYFLYIGTIQPRKNLVRLIDAFALADLPTFQLVLAGKRGWLTNEIEARSRELGIAGRVHFIGYVADDDIPTLLSGARALVLPSLYEGFGLTALEAMACGTPVLASRVASLPEVVGDAGLLVDPLDTADIAQGLVTLATDDALCDQLRQRGLERVQEWSWSRCARETLTVLTEAGVGNHT